MAYYIIYYDTPDIKQDMNELVIGFRWILLRLGAMHYQPDLSCIIIGLCTMCGYQMLPFDWVICVTCAVHIKQLRVYSPMSSLPVRSELYDTFRGISHLCLK